MRRGHSRSRLGIDPGKDNSSNLGWGWDFEKKGLWPVMVFPQTFICSVSVLCLGFPCGSADLKKKKSLPAMLETWVGKIPWRRERLPTPGFWPGEFMDCIVHGIAKSRMWLSDFHFSVLGTVLASCRRDSKSPAHGGCVTSPCHEHPPLYL